MTKLPFISDSDLETAVRHLLTKAHDALKTAEAGRNKNIIDPFAALFEMAGFQIDEPTWRMNEKTRQAQKSLQNHVGAFHQVVLGSVLDWSNPGSGGIIDLESSKHKVIAEIKNKYNTISGGKLKDLYTELEELIMPKTSRYKGYTAYYVEIIPRTAQRYDKPFTPSDKSKGALRASNELIRVIDGYSFYSKVTGIDDALAQLFHVLPSIIESEVGLLGYRFNDTQFLHGFFRAAFG